MNDRKLDQIIDGALEILKVILAGARSNDPLAKQAALDKSEQIARKLKP